MESETMNGGKPEVATKVRRVSDVLGTGEINFYPEDPRVDIQAIFGVDVTFLDAKVLRDWPSDYSRRGVSDWVLLRVELPTGEIVTTKCGGQVVVRRVAELQSRRLFPIVGSIVTAGDSDKSYYNII